MDALARLTAQHRHIDNLLVRVGDGERGAISELAELVTVHLALEEVLLHPRVAPALRDELTREHVEIRRVLAELVWRDADGTADDRAPFARELRELLEGHSLWQELELYPVFSEHADLDVVMTEVSASFEALAA